MSKLFFQPFKTDISGIPLPVKFTFPFYYEPHQLSILAAKELQEYLTTQTDFEHNFGLQENQTGLVIGKMFGVLVCQDKEENLGYLWAFSGKLAENNHLNYFVPPVFDMLQQDGFFKKEEEVLNAINREIESLKKDSNYLLAQEHWATTQKKATEDLQNQKERIKELKIARDLKRQKFATNATPTEIEAFEHELSEESKKESILLKKMTKYWNYQLEDAKKEMLVFSDKIEE